MVPLAAHRDSWLLTSLLSQTETLWPHSFLVHADALRIILTKRGSKFWLSGIYMWYLSQAKKRSILCSSIVTFQAAMSFLSPSSLCGYICCLGNLLLPLRNRSLWLENKDGLPFLGKFVRGGSENGTIKSKGKTMENSEMNQDFFFQGRCQPKNPENQTHITSTACTWNSLGKGSFFYF